MEKAAAYNTEIKGFYFMLCYILIGCFAVYRSKILLRFSVVYPSDIIICPKSSYTPVRSTGLSLVL